MRNLMNLARKEWRGISSGFWAVMLAGFAVRAAINFEGKAAAEGAQAVSMCLLFAVLTMLARPSMMRHLSAVRRLLAGLIAAIGLIAGLFSSDPDLQTQTLLLAIPLAAALWMVQTRMEAQRQALEDDRHEDLLAAIRSAACRRDDR